MTLCVRCQRRTGGPMLGAYTKRDVIAALDGRLSWAEAEAHCPQCLHWMLSMPTEQSRLNHIATLHGHGKPANYPEVMTEWATMWHVLHARRSLCRFGDGELRLCLGGSAISQKWSAPLQHELRYALSGKHALLTGIPRIVGPKVEKTWYKYNTPKFVSLYDMDRVYASAFITRPDSAPWIDQPQYWAMVRALWQRKHVILVSGSDHSLRPADVQDAASVTIVEGPYRDAYESIDDIEARIGDATGKVVLLCLGACATVLAVRLHQKLGVQALDLGHIGRMMRVAGRWANASDVSSVEY